ncbi:unnamed protein product, partial [Gadus morhua 'NCC']
MTREGRWEGQRAGEWKYQNLGCSLVGSPSGRDFVIGQSAKGQPRGLSPELSSSLGGAGRRGGTEGQERTRGDSHAARRPEWTRLNLSVNVPLSLASPRPASVLPQEA